LSSSICSWVIGSPSSFSVSARAIHSLLQVRNFISGEKIYCISRLAYRSESGLTYLSVLILFVLLYYFMTAGSNNRRLIPYHKCFCFSHESGTSANSYGFLLKTFRFISSTYKRT